MRWCVCLWCGFRGGVGIEDVVNGGYVESACDLRNDPEEAGPVCSVCAEPQVPVPHGVLHGAFPHRHSSQWSLFTVEPPVLPYQLLDVSTANFKQILRKQDARLQARFTLDDINSVQEQFRELRAAAERDSTSTCLSYYLHLRLFTQIRFARHVRLIMRTLNSIRAVARHCLVLG